MFIYVDLHLFNQVMPVKQSMSSPLVFGLHLRDSFLRWKLDILCSPCGGDLIIMTMCRPTRAASSTDTNRFTVLVGMASCCIMFRHKQVYCFSRNGHWLCPPEPPEWNPKELPGKRTYRTHICRSTEGRGVI